MASAARPRRPLRRLTASYAIVTLPPEAGWPWWATWSTGLVALVRDAAECTVVCETRLVPETATAQRDYAAFVVEGPIPFDEVGLMAALSAPLAAAGISLFVVSSYATDYILVPLRAADDATRVWRQAGYEVVTG